MPPSLINVAFFGLMATLLYTPPAAAYLDPGTGSMMLQMLLGGIAGAVVVGKLYWHRLKEVVTSRFSSKPSDAAPARHVNASSETDAPHD